ncbi:MAG: NAD(P)H-hydrate dehydratase [Proteobacteria bacterium]|nr:NAD(P)H-hydrate dehydratase [Pseudomonadota bacterium]
MELVSAWQMQQMDKKTIRDFGIPGMVLMESAGRGATRILLEAFGGLSGRLVGIMAGRGNNGGDGFVMARYLACHQIPVVVYLLGDMTAVQGDARTNLEILSRMDVPIIEIRDQKDLLKHKSAMTHRDIWVDAIFGTGLNAEVTGFYRLVIEFINKLEKPVLSVDIPSGLHPDTGQALGVCIKAHVTATFAYAKTGMLLYPGADYAGRIEIVDIGIPPHIVREALIFNHLSTPDMIHDLYRIRPSDSHKGTAGHLLVVAGSRGKSGAAALCAEAAMRIGAGLVTLGIPESLDPVLETLLKEVMTLPLSESRGGVLAKSSLEEIRRALTGKQGLVLGPGLGLDSQTVAVVHALLRECPVPVVLDADALNSMEGHTGRLKDMATDSVLTPHPREMARLTGKTVEEIQKDRLGIAQAFAEKFKVHLVLKGARTVVAHPDGSAYINPTGNPLLASGGTGDVLTGMIAGLICQGYEAAHAARMGVYLHGAVADMLAKERGPVGVLASELAVGIPRIMAMTAACLLPPLPFIAHRL